MCTGGFVWPFDLPADGTFELNIRLPVDDYRGASDLAELRNPSADDLDTANTAFWKEKLDRRGLHMDLPPIVSHLFELFRLCRATLLILADNGEIHPGPTIYDSFWVRDSAVEGIACAVAGDTGLAMRQFGEHYPTVYNPGFGQIGPAAEHGFFGGKHERDDHEWDSNGEALWAFGRFDRIQGASTAFGAKMYSPYVEGGSRWIRDNRSPVGLLLSGWSAEHLGESDKPHYWDDLWAVAGLYEAARLAERIGAAETDELWATYEAVRRATTGSILWALERQREMGYWQTFVPAGPADVGRLDSTIIGAVAYFHPCRLYMGKKLGDDVDAAMRHTLDTIWGHFVDGGFEHNAAWNAYGPYLTLQLAHAFLFLGDIARMDACLRWAVDDAAYARVSRQDGEPAPWQVVSGAWNEQHAYPIATDFARVPTRWWYMGDIPHGWAAAEFNLLLRDICLFEADEDGTPHIYLAAGLPSHWLSGGETLRVRDAPTVLGAKLGYDLRQDVAAGTVTIDIVDAPTDVSFIYPCRLGAVISATADGVGLAVAGSDVALPAGTRRAVVEYA